MTNEQILKVLKNERECIARQSRPLGEMPQCRKDDDGVKLCEYCDLCLPDDEILEVYDFLIEAYSITEIHINVSKEEAEKLFEIINRTAQEGVRLAVLPYPDVGASYPTVTLETDPDEYGREHFKGICPYTNIKCEKWTCGICEVAERERKFAEGDTE